jgi:hypothetical protein
VIDSIKLGNEDLSFSIVDYQERVKKLTINLPADYDSTTELTLNFFAHKSDYLFTIKDKLIAGYNILGQEGKPFKMPMDISFASDDKEKTFAKVMVDEKEEILTLTSYNSVYLVRAFSPHPNRLRRLLYQKFVCIPEVFYPALLCLKV